MKATKKARGRSINQQLLDACAHGSPQEVKELLAQGADPTFEENSYNAIQRACQFGRVEVVRCLLQHEPDLANHVNSQGWTPGHTASCYGVIKIVQLLICYGAQSLPNPKTHRATPLDDAQERRRRCPHNKCGSNNPADYDEIIRLWQESSAATSGAANRRRVVGNPALFPDSAPSPQGAAAELGAVAIVGDSSDRVPMTPSDKIQQVTRALAAVAPPLGLDEIVNQSERFGTLLKKLACSRDILLNCWVFLYPNEFGQFMSARDVKTLAMLVDIGLNLKQESQSGYTLLQTVIFYSVAKKFYSEERMLQLLTMLVEKGVMINQVSSRYGSTALHVAAFYGKQKVVDLLIENGADPTIVEKRGKTAAMLATERFEYFREKHEHWPSYQKISESLRQVALNPSLYINQALYRKWAKNGAFAELELAFIDAVQAGKTDEVEYLLVHYPKVLGVRLSNYPIVHIAASCCQLEILKKLKETYEKQRIAYPINEVCGDRGRTPLHLAVISGDVETVRWLVKNGADPTMQNNQGYSALHEAAAKGRNEIVLLFLENKINVNLLSSCGWPVLFSAARFGHLEIVKTLMARGADLGLLGPYGTTVLDNAIKGSSSDIYRRSQHLEVIKLFLENGLKYRAPSSHVRDDIAALLATYKGQEEGVTSPSEQMDEGKPLPANMEEKPLLRRLLQLDLFGVSGGERSSSVALRATRRKDDGSNPGAIYTVDGVDWLGKMGYDVLLTKESCGLLMGSRTRTDMGVKLDAVKEKIGMDFYAVLASEPGPNHYEVPDTRLAILPVRDELILENETYGRKVKDTFFGHNIEETVFVMSRWCKEFLSLQKVGDGKFKQQIRDGYLPEEIVFKSQKISTDALVCLLANARILGDVDVFGVSLSNIGLIFDAATRTFSWMKLDGTHTFHGFAPEDDVINSALYQINQRDPRNIQYHARGFESAVIEWAKLTSRQKEIYIAELAKGIAFCQDQVCLEFMLERLNVFQQYVDDERLDNPYLIWKSRWIAKQAEVYKDELEAYRTSNPEATKNWLRQRMLMLGLPLAIPSEKPVEVAAISRESQPQGQTTRLIPILLSEFREYWKTRRSWKFQDIFEMTMRRVDGDQEVALRVLGVITNQYGVSYLLKVLQRRVQSGQVQSLEGINFSDGDTINAVMKKYAHLLSSTEYVDGQPFFQLITLLQNGLRHPRGPGFFGSAEVGKPKSPARGYTVNVDSEVTLSQTPAAPSVTPSSPVPLTVAMPQLTITRNPEADKYYAKAKAAAMLGRYEQAIECYQRARDSYKQLISQGTADYQAWGEKRLQKIKAKLKTIQAELTSANRRSQP